MSLAQGQIVWAEIPDSRGGNVKARPVVVLTPTSDISPTGNVRVAAISSLIGEAPFSHTVELPSDPSGHLVTGLKRPCEVVCSWACEVAVSLMQDASGSVPKKLLIEILEKVDRLV